jgi:hypothetical protein
LTKDEAIDKVRKLLELSKSPNENEAAQAAAKARQILSNYNLSMADLPLDEIRATLDIMEKAVDEDATLGIWIQNLLIHVCRGFDCTHIIAKRKEGTKVIFIGDEADAEIAASTFEFLKREIRRLCSESLPLLVKQLGRKWTPRQLEESYLEGAVHRIGEKLQKRIDQIKKTEAEKCTALVLMKEDMLEEYLEKKFPEWNYTEREQKRGVPEAFAKGYLDAGVIQVRKSIGGENVN